MRSPARRLRLPLGLGCAMIAVLLTACTSPRSNLGTSDSSCYRALPVATQAVHSHGHLLGIHLFTEAKLRSIAPRLVLELVDSGMVMHGPMSVCAAAFTGSFMRSGVERPISDRQTGKFAVVVVKEPSNDLLGTAIFRRAPLRFSHTHLG